MEKKSLTQLDPNLVVSPEEVTAKLFRLKALPAGAQYNYLHKRGWQLEQQGTSLDPASKWLIPDTLRFVKHHPLSLESALRLQCAVDLVVAKGCIHAKEATEPSKS